MAGYFDRSTSNHPNATNSAINSATLFVTRLSATIALTCALTSCLAGLATPSLAQEQSMPDSESPQSFCPEPALSRLQTYTVSESDTLESIAAQYDLLSSTLLGFNSALQQSGPVPGMEIVIPPYNGIRAAVPAGSSWTEIATQYGIRADVLFEVNGCQPPDTVVFIPGVNWSPVAIAETENSAVLTTYPLPEIAPIIRAYGWQVDSELSYRPDSAREESLIFHSGVDLSAAIETPVYAAGPGVIAFAEPQGNYGNLIVLNHADGLQTRYGQLQEILVEVGQEVTAGEQIGTVGMSGLAQMPHLHFEVRLNSSFGWVAENPGRYIPDAGLR